MIWPGEKQAWSDLESITPCNVESNAIAEYNSQDSEYKIKCLGQDIDISLKEHSFESSSNLGKFILDDLGIFSRLSILSYLINSKNIPFTNKLIKPSNLKDGNIFIHGSHVLPLNKMSDLFMNNADDLLLISKEVGGFKLDYGDLAFRYSPFPRIPIVLIFWSADTEFPAKCSVLFDSSCSQHLSTAVLWSTAMLTAKLLLDNVSKSVG